jgi:hypothetical protein
MVIVEQNEGFVTSYLCQFYPKFVYNVNGVLSATDLLKCCMFTLQR